MIDLIRKYHRQPDAVKSAAGIAEAIEAAIRAGTLSPGEKLLPVRALADDLQVSPATVAAAYQSLSRRGLLVAEGRRGTRVSPRPMRSSRRFFQPPPDTRDLASGNPDPALLPDLSRALRAIDPAPRLYGAPPIDERLAQLLARDLRRAGVACGSLVAVNGAMDGIDRVLEEHTRPGERVAIEDPGFSGIIDLLLARGLTPTPVAIDQEGLLPEALDQVARTGTAVAIMTPRAQSPTGAALTAGRAAALRAVLARHRDLLIIEDDHAGRVLDVPLHVLHDQRTHRWAHVHSFSKALDPDLRLAVVTGDERTVARLNERMVVAERWVSHLLQRIVAYLITDRSTGASLRRAARTYTRRRRALLKALKTRGVAAFGSSGYNVWAPVPEETPLVQGLASRGWAVAAGERFRLASPPGIRITAATLAPEDADRFAEDLADLLRGEGFPTV